ncbi:LeuA family protein [Halomarina litorea]|uniref:LeuA family protein n=1 Tax=Halomarina litorea TaxID=2961595 RepID=UPI0020C36ED4|nr:citramalate synthase [Halomarina sp. BCD28]
MRLNDVTLREGAQMPGRDYTAEQKLAAGAALDDLGLPFVQPGFPATGETDRRVVRELAETLDADVIGLARALEGDVDAAIDSDADVVEVFVSASDLHLEHLLGKSRAEMREMLVGSVEYVRERGGVPHVTLADAFRTDPGDLADLFAAVPDAAFVTLADSVGVRTPASVRAHLDSLVERGVDPARVGVHFHDDLGCATANALAAYEAGVGKADVSVAALGERAGNSPLEEVVVACSLEHDDSLGVDEGSLVTACRGVLDALGESWDDRKAVLGSAVAEHESGIHTAAMLRDPATLEPYDPGRFGGERRLVFGRKTGRGGARQVLERADVDADDETVEAFRESLAAAGPLELAEAIALADREFGG